MPNHNVISQEQREKAVRFRVAAALGNLEEVKKNCDAYTLDAMDAKGNTALHFACENNHTQILKFLFQQPQINCHQANNAGKEAVDLIKDLSIAELFKKKLNESQELTKNDLSTINDYVKKTLSFGAPNWMQKEFPHQSPTKSSTWEKDNSDYYRIDVLQEIFLLIEEKMELILKNDPNALFIVLSIFHSALAESLKVGRCDEQVAVAFSQFLLTEKKGSVEWIRAVNLDGKGGHNFIVLNRNIETDINNPNTWKQVLLLDPMDDRVENLTETTTKLMVHLTRIISQTDAAKIRLQPAIGLTLPLKAKHHGHLIDPLNAMKHGLQLFFKDNWVQIWSDMSSKIKQEHALTTLPVEEETVKKWIGLVWESLDGKIRKHEALKEKLITREDTSARLTQRSEVLRDSGFTQMLNALKLR